MNTSMKRVFFTLVLVIVAGISGLAGALAGGVAVFSAELLIHRLAGAVYLSHLKGIS